MRLAKRGFTLVELMIVVAIIGVLAALAIYGVRKYVLSAKTAEARRAVGRMAQDAASAFNREGMAGNVLALGSVAGLSARLCGTASNTVPTAGITQVQGQKYQSDPSEWSGDNQLVGWQCVRFTMADPQYYMYSYTATGTTGTAGESFTSIAQGDLDGDSLTSQFTLTGDIQASGGGELVVTIAPNLVEAAPDE